jgi:hypothetical protein
MAAAFPPEHHAAMAGAIATSQRIGRESKAQGRLAHGFDPL